MDTVVGAANLFFPSDCYSFWNQIPGLGELFIPLKYEEGVFGISCLVIQIKPVLIYMITRVKVFIHLRTRGKVKIKNGGKRKSFHLLVLSPNTHVCLRLALASCIEGLGILTRSAMWKTGTQLHKPRFNATHGMHE